MNTWKWATAAGLSVIAAVSIVHLTPLLDRSAETLTMGMTAHDLLPTHGGGGTCLRYFSQNPSAELIHTVAARLHAVGLTHVALSDVRTDIQARLATMEESHHAQGEVDEILDATAAAHGIAYRILIALKRTRLRDAWFERMNDGEPARRTIALLPPGQRAALDGVLAESPEVLTFTALPDLLNQLRVLEP